MTKIVIFVDEVLVLVDEKTLIQFDATEWS